MENIFDKYITKIIDNEESNEHIDNNVNNENTDSDININIGKKYKFKPVVFGNSLELPKINNPVNINTTQQYTADGKPVFNISQTIIKQFSNKKGEHIQYCPFKIYTCYIIRSHSIIKSLAMMKGLYFEYLCLGSSAYDNNITDLPRINKESKNKTIDQLRIEQQGVKFKQLCSQYGINITKENTQKKYSIPYLTEWDNELQIYLGGTVDFEHPIYHNNELLDCVIDIKLTSNINNTFGDFGWGNPQYMDHIQFDIYNFLTNKKCIYWVFDYSKNMNQEIFVHYPDEEDIKMMHHRIKHAIIELKYCLDMGWEQIGNYESCKNCPHNPKNAGICLHADNIKVI